MTNGILNNEDPNILRVFVVRHGQTDYNMKKILQGHLDVDINETGKRQARLVGGSLSGIKFDRFDTSDLVRCQNTSKEITKYFQKIDSEVTSDLRERNMGVVQGMYIKDAQQTYGKDFRHLGEASKPFIDRIERYWNRLIEQSIEAGYENVGFCTHGGVKKALFSHMYRHLGYELGPELTPDSLRAPFNTSVSIVDIDKSNGKGTIQIFGATGHLGGQYEVEDQNLR